MFYFSWVYDELLLVLTVEPWQKNTHFLSSGIFGRLQTHKNVSGLKCKLVLFELVSCPSFYCFVNITFCGLFYEKCFRLFLVIFIIYNLFSWFKSLYWIIPFHVNDLKIYGVWNVYLRIENLVIELHLKLEIWTIKAL